jgi:hypothetical protein
MTRKAWITYEVLVLIIALGTAIDIFWSIVTVEHLIKQELNPIARWVIRFGDNLRVASALPYQGVALLCCAKVLGTWAVLRICQYATKHHPRFGWPILSTVAAFQLLLILFLFLGA